MRTSKPHPELAPAGYQGLLQVVRHVRASSLGHGLLNLVELRASQLNGCAYCMDMHATAALEAGESPRRLNLVGGWREAPVFTPREQAALAWTEALTELGRHGVDDALYAATRAHFTEQELVDLTYAIALINAWNRLGVGLQPDLPGVPA
ncbi:carboxymuconolactone decarboxylase family protein [Geothrix fuzhouensis]|uniref:carboxymuconolactone decarboxylase family protein n=1 Tax=Geothrix fuzhouensis TaxID=2966451 RepID=UPI00214933E3|nr:carboxymuconolactone decarboxylase family protein [Geothrix fuzhouensis]